METEHILEKGSGKINEDALVMEENMFGVFDGATSLDRTLFDGCKTGGMIASETACSVFAKNGYPLAKLARLANREIGETMRCHGVDGSARERLWSTSAAVARIEGKALEWVQSGDSAIVLIYQDRSHKVLVDQPDHDYETLSIWKQMASTSQVTIGEALAEQIKKTRQGMNRSYGVLNGECQAEGFIHAGVESLDKVTDILLFTDGLQLPSKKPTPRKGFDDLVHHYLALGLHGLRDRIRSVEKNDPQCRQYPRFKCHDDIAAISIRF
jgi:serine/threonine protein phosphatase PrpC